MPSSNQGPETHVKEHLTSRLKHVNMCVCVCVIVKGERENPIG